jgi:hypothetical protein
VGKSIGVICPRGKISHADCRVCVQDPLHPCQYSPDILESMRREDLHVEEGTYSATQLLNCDRQDVLVNQIEGGYYQDVDSSWATLRGSMVHALMERQTYPGAVEVIRERRLHTTVATSFGRIPFSGQIDLLVVKKIEDNIARVKVVDFKSTYQIDHDLVAAKDDHQMQINIYKWLVESTMFFKQDGFVAPVVVDELEIVYADMRKARRFTSVQGERVDKGKLIRKLETYAGDEVLEHYSNGKLYETIHLQPIRFLSNEQIEKWVVRRIEAKERAKRGEMPGRIADDRRWLCMYCPVNKECERIERDGASS